jgi:hypothetical protein
MVIYELVYKVQEGTRWDSREKQIAKQVSLRATLISLTIDADWKQYVPDSKKKLILDDVHWNEVGTIYEIFSSFKNMCDYLQGIEILSAVYYAFIFLLDKFNYL